MSDSLQPPAARASDQDREKTVERLSRAATDGRLEVDELEERLQRATTARTRAELEPLTADLPEAAPELPETEPRPTFVRSESSGLPGVGFVLSILGYAKRTGRWRLKKSLSAVAILGVVKLDLTEAEASAPKTRIAVFSVLSKIEIRAPEGVVVDVNSLPILSNHDVDNDPAEPVAEDAPRIQVNLISTLSDVRVRRGNSR